MADPAGGALGEARVDVRANIVPLEQGFADAKQATVQFDKQLQAAVDGSIRRFEQAVNQFAATIDTRLNRALATSTQVTNNFNQAATTSSQSTAGFNRALLVAATSARNFNASVGQFNQTGQAIAQSVQQLQASITQFNQAVTQFGQRANRTAPQASAFAQRLNQITAAFGLIPGPAGAAAARISALLTTVSGLHPALAAAGIAIGAVGLAFAQASREAEAFERSQLRTEALLRATGFAAGVTAQDINRLGEEIEGVTLATSDDVKAAAQALVQFGNVSGEEFERTLRLAQDLSGSFGSMTAAVEAIGRAFERPAEAARMFRRIGLHESVLLEAAAMQEAGREAESYTFILDALTKKVGGTGVGEAQGLTGAYHRASDAVGDFFRRLGQGTGILEAQAKGYDAVARAINRLSDAAFGPDQAAAPTDPAAARAARDAAQRALEERKRADARAEQLKAEAQARKDAAEEIKRLAKAEKDRADQQEIQREAAVEAALMEVAITERLLPELLQSGMAREDISRAIEDQIKLEKQLADLGLKSTSIDAQRLISAKIIADINRALVDAVGGADEFSKSQQRVNEALREAQVVIDDLGNATVFIGKPETVQATEDFRQRLREVIAELKAAGVSTELLERNLEGLAQRFGEVDALNRSTQLLSEMIDQVDALNREINIQARTFGMSAGAAAAYRVEQEALARQIKLTGAVTAEQLADIKALSLQYGAAAQAAADFSAKQEAASFASGELSRFLSDLRTGAASVGDAFMALADSIAEAIIQGSLFGQGPLAGILGSKESGGLIGGAIGSLLGLGKDPAAGAADAVAAVTGGGDAAAATGLATAATGLSAAATGFAAPTAALSTAAGALSASAAALTAAATALGVSAGADAGADAASAGAEALAKVGSIHTGRRAGDARPPLSRVVPISTFIRAPRLHSGLRQGEFPAILEQGEEVTPKSEVRKNRAGDTFIFNVDRGAASDDSFRRSIPQNMARAAEQQFVSRRRSR